ncbi:uncharacterized protein LOC111285923 [Durio zibethinus]|uniref:Uncharacterized protein LOC111285923 n=1 Tax=Durio zibethinus TaxID=66656 RepID=A0A6P5XSY7_DURZI|nr:uncharacterized protein LOC111285923 [Durio zibethinus]
MSDFLGVVYPIRDGLMLSSEYKCVIERLKLLKALIHFPQDLLNVVTSNYRQGLSIPDVTLLDMVNLAEVKKELDLLYRKWQTILCGKMGLLCYLRRLVIYFLLMKFPWPMIAYWKG